MNTKKGTPDLLYSELLKEWGTPFLQLTSFQLSLLLFSG
jgi:hypothetical protein